MKKAKSKSDLEDKFECLEFCEGTIVHDREKGSIAELEYHVDTLIVFKVLV